MFRLTGEVANTIHGAIVFAYRFGQLYSVPSALIRKKNRNFCPNVKYNPLNI